MSTNEVEIQKRRHLTDTGMHVVVPCAIDVTFIQDDAVRYTLRSNNKDEPRVIIGTDVHASGI
jgi:hypothetical protein